MSQVIYFKPIEIEKGAATKLVSCSLCKTSKVELNLRHRLFMLAVSMNQKHVSTESLYLRFN